MNTAQKKEFHKNYFGSALAILFSLLSASAANAQIILTGVSASYAGTTSLYQGASPRFNDTTSPAPFYDQTQYLDVSYNPSNTFVTSVSISASGTNSGSGINLNAAAQTTNGDNSSFSMSDAYDFYVTQPVQFLLSYSYNASPILTEDGSQFFGGDIRLIASSNPNVTLAGGYFDVGGAGTPRIFSSGGSTLVTLNPGIGYSLDANMGASYITSTASGSYSLSFTPVSAPEPSTLVLMFGGFGLVAFFRKVQWRTFLRNR